MTIQQAPRAKVARRLLAATVAFVLGAWMYPSIAATGTDSRSDQPLDAPPMSLSADRELPLPVIDHATATTLASDALPRDDCPTEAVPDIGLVAGTRVDIMLRRIVDEAQAHQPPLERPQDDDDFHPPLAVDQSEPLENPRGVLEVDRAEAAAQLPGFGADELLHYRRQMYRTDI